jgi:hypothetical protein
MNIQDDIINPSVRDEISSFLSSRKKWRNVGICMETTSKIMLGITSILSFSTSVYPCNIYLSFSSGTIATLSLVFLQFANYSFKESKLSTDNLNTLLTKFNVTTLPELNASVLKQSPLNSTDSKDPVPEDLKQI